MHYLSHSVWPFRLIEVLSLLFNFFDKGIFSKYSMKFMRTLLTAVEHRLSSFSQQTYWDITVFYVLYEQNRMINKESACLEDIRVCRTPFQLIQITTWGFNLYFNSVSISFLKKYCSKTCFLFLYTMIV